MMKLKCNDNRAIALDSEQGVKEKYLISVIIPVYNVEPYIFQCLDSIIHQTYQNLEIIIIDDGSPDNCGKICDEYAQKDHRIIVIHKQNEGLCAARNDGIKKATGDWIAFVDSDDWCELDYCSKFIESIGNATPDVILSGGYIQEYSHRHRVINTIRSGFSCPENKSVPSVMANILAFGGPWAKLYKADFLKNNRLLFDTDLKAFEDFEFNIRVYSYAQRIVGSTFIGYHYRQVAVSITKGFNPEKPRICYDFISKLHDYIIHEQLVPEAMQAARILSNLTFRVALDCYFFHPANQKSYEEVAREIKNMKTWPYYHEAIWDNNNQYLSKQQIILKYALRLPWIWPVKVLHWVKQKQSM